MATLSFVSFDNVHPDELGSADLDPEAIISELEQTLLEDYSLNLKGITVAQATNPVLSSADALALGKVNTRYTDLLDVIGQADPRFAPPRPATYAATCRGRRVGQRPRFETWAYPLLVGQRMPTLPIWLADDLAVSLDLESSYEETCQALRIS